MMVGSAQVEFTGETSTHLKLANQSPPVHPSNLTYPEPISAPGEILLA